MSETTAKLRPYWVQEYAGKWQVVNADNVEVVSGIDTEVDAKQFLEWVRSEDRRKDHETQLQAELAAAIQERDELRRKLETLMKKYSQESAEINADFHKGRKNDDPDDLQEQRATRSYDYKTFAYEIYRLLEAAKKGASDV